MTFDAKRATELAEQCEEDDRDAAPAPWVPNVWIETDGNEWRGTGPGHDSEDCEDCSPGCSDEQAAQRDAHAIARTRNSLADVAKQLRAAVSEVERLRAGVINACSLLDDAVQLRDDAASWFPKIDELRRVALPHLPQMAGYENDNGEDK